jgi:hypothetical protein
MSTMHDGDLPLIDADPKDPFYFFTTHTTPITTISHERPR